MPSKTLKTAPASITTHIPSHSAGYWISVILLEQTSEVKVIDGPYKVEHHDDSSHQSPLLFPSQSPSPSIIPSFSYQPFSYQLTKIDHSYFLPCCSRYLACCSWRLALRSSSCRASAFTVCCTFHFFLRSRKPGRRQLWSLSSTSRLIWRAVVFQKTCSSLRLNSLQSERYSSMKGFYLPVSTSNCAYRLGNKKLFSVLFPTSTIRSSTPLATSASTSRPTPGQEKLRSSSSTQRPVLAYGGEQRRLIRSFLLLTPQNWQRRLITTTFSALRSPSRPFTALLQLTTEYSGWFLSAPRTSPTKACSLPLPTSARFVSSSLSMLGVASSSRQERVLRPSATSALNLRRKASSAARMMAVASSASCPFMQCEVCQLNPSSTHNIQIASAFIRVVNFEPASQPLPSPSRRPSASSLLPSVRNRQFGGVAPCLSCGDIIWN